MMKGEKSMQETIEGRLPVSSQKIGEKTIEYFKKMLNPEVLENFIIEVSETNKSIYVITS